MRQEAVVDEDEIVEDEVYDEDEDEYFDKEEVEVAVDEFISSLVSSKLIRKPKTGRLLTIGSVFAKFFGEEGEIVELAREFENDIAGYMGWISPAKMKSAEERFAKILNLVRSILKEVPHGH